MMKGGLLDLFKDAGGILRFRYKEAAEYQYGFLPMLAIIVALGISNALGMQAVFGNGLEILALAVVLSFFKVFSMSLALSRVLHYFGSPRLPLFAYILVSEALTLPSILFFYEKDLAVLSLPWQIWTFSAQLLGLVALSQRRYLHIFIAFLVYMLLFFVFGVLTLMVFHSAAWIDVQVIEQNIQQLMKMKS